MHYNANKVTFCYCGTCVPYAFAVKNLPQGTQRAQRKKETIFSRLWCIIKFMITTITELRSFVQSQRLLGKRVGLVPTMGALHKGHLSLVRLANEQCDATVVSIFVNPAQFGPNEDFSRYPRTLEDDLRLLKTTGSPAVFVPEATEMYPAGFDSSVHIGSLSLPFEGAIRPGHFDGVATVVLKLFLVSQADVAFFGQKDYQQLCVIKKMVADLNIPIAIMMGPTIREPDGLAMSSRNRYLSESERRRAVVLSQSLAAAERMIVTEKIRSAETIRQAIREQILSAGGMTIDYIAVADPLTLQELSVIETESVILLAVQLGSTRLIDNALVKIRNCNGSN
jgi:pantoate--beta-alanine ligase